MSSSSGAIPIPVSTHSNSMIWGDVDGGDVDDGGVDDERGKSLEDSCMVNVTPPSWVNFIALLKRFEIKFCLTLRMLRKK